MKINDSENEVVKCFRSQKHDIYRKYLPRGLADVIDALIFALPFKQRVVL